MWAETSPGGRLIWTSSGDDLLAYRSTPGRRPAIAGPAGPLLQPVRRLVGAVPPSGVTGAVFSDGKLLLAGETAGLTRCGRSTHGPGRRQLVIEMDICGESEGLDRIPDARRPSSTG